MTDAITKTMEALFEALVPSSGKAETEAGELLRAYARLNYRYLNDGDVVGVGYGNETCNPAARYLEKHGNDLVRQDVGAMWGMYGDERYEGLLSALERHLYEMLATRDELYTNPTEDMWDLATDDDVEWEEDEDWYDWYDEEEDECEW